jgi:hypothetical protein
LWNENISQGPWEDREKQKFSLRAITCMQKFHRNLAEHCANDREVVMEIIQDMINLICSLDPTLGKYKLLQINFILEDVTFISEPEEEKLKQGDTDAYFDVLERMGAIVQLLYQDVNIIL